MISDAQGFGASTGVGAANLPWIDEEIEEMDGREVIDGRELIEGREEVVATLGLRLPREGRLFCCSLAAACRSALP